MNAHSFSWGRLASLVVGFLVSIAPALAATPVAGPNVNMVTGTQWPAGDPLLTKQNEPSIAVSSVNPRHLLAGANDYRLVDPAIPLPGDEGGDAWVTLIKSTDGGITWRTSLIPGCPLNIPECNTPASPVKGLAFAADPTLRPGPYGTFFYSFIAGNRGTGTGGVTAVQRIVDTNTAVKSDDDPFFVDGVNILDVGTTGQFKDKPWNAADVPGRAWNTGTCVIPGYNNGTAVPAFNVYVSYTNFVGQSTGNPHPQILVARSTDCGATFGKPVKLSQSVDTNSGSQVVIEPQTGTVYVVWRRFADPSAGTGDAVWMSYSNDGGNKWVGPTQVASIIPYDQGSSGTTFRTNDTPAIAVSVDSTGTSRLHVAFSQRKAAINPVTLSCTDTTNNNCDARLTLMSATITKSGASTGALGAWQTKSIDDWQSDARFDGSFPGSWPAGGHRRGHQFMPALTFAGGKLMAVWLDQRYDHTIGRLVCTSSPTNNCDSLLKFTEIRVPAGDPSTTSPGNLTSSAGIGTVFTPYITDGTPGLLRRHTLDVFGAMASVDDPTLTFTSTRVSRYAFGVMKAKSAQSAQVFSYNIDQLQQNPPNLPIAAGGTTPFIGDYTDVAAQIIVPTGNALQPYAFNCGPAASGFCANLGTSPAFYPAWTDNRDVVRPKSGDWTNHTPIVQFGTSNTSLACVKGQDGDRNSNVYTALVGDTTVALPNANSKLLTATAPRGFVIGVQNLIEPANAKDANYRSFVLTILGAAPTGGSASFNPGNSVQKVVVSVPPSSSASRSVWVKSTNPGARVSVDVAMILDASGNPVTTPVTNADPNAYANVRSVSQIVLNPDPNGTLLGNADGTNPATTPDVIDNNQGITGDEEPATVLVDANPLTIGTTAYALSNAGTTNLALNNLALNNYALNNLALNNYALSNLALNNLALNNYALNNYALNNATDYNYALSNYALSNYALNNLALNNVTVDNTDIGNYALNNYALSNYALNNYALSNNSFSNLALNNESVVDTTVTITNDGNTDTTLALKTLLNSGNIPQGMSIQLLLRKVALSPAASADPSANTIGSCSIGVVQQNSQVASFAQPEVTAPTDAGLITFPSASPADQNADPLAATLPLSSKEKAYVTLRVVGPSCVVGRPVIECATYLFAKYGTKVVAVDASKTTNAPAPTQVPLVITSFNVISMAGSNASLTATGGAGALTWAPLANPPSDVTPLLGSDIVVNANGTISVGPNVPTGDYVLYVTVRDTGAPGVSAQYDQQRVTLRVFTFSFPGEVAFANNLPVGANLPLNASTVPPIPISYSLDPVLTTPNACHFDNPLLPTQLIGGPSPGTCVLIITIGDSTVLQTVNIVRTYTVKNAQTITFPAVAAQTYSAGGTFTVSATASSGLPVTFSSMTPLVCAVTGNTVTILAAGTCTIAADQAGSANTYFAAPTVQQDIAINKAGQTIAFPVVTPAPIYSAGGTFGVSATASSGAAVTFSSTTPLVCTVAGNTVTILSAGTCTIAANQAGDSNYQPASQVTQGVVISRAAQAITFAAVAAQTYSPSGTFGVSATASSGLGVAFSSTTLSVCTVAGNTVTIVTAGTCTIAADQGGGTNYLSALQVTQNITINKATQTIAFPAVAAQTYSPSGTFGVSATASSGLGVTFSSTTPLVCTVAGNTVTIVTAATCTITADQSGNGNYLPATQVKQDIVISKAPQTIAFPTVTPAPTYSAGGTFTVSATASSGLAVTFSSTTLSVCTVAGTTGTIVTGGTCTIAADQSGSVNYLAAPQVKQDIIIGKAAQAITFPTVAAKTYSPSGTFTVSATASSGLTVTFSSTTPSVCTVAGITVTILAGGTCTIAADQTGGTNYLAAPQVSQNITINKATQTIAFTPVSSPTFSPGGTFTVSATASSGLAVSFGSLTTAVCTVSGSTVTMVAAGTCTLTADQAGNVNYNSAPQVTQSFTIAKAAQTITFAQPGDQTYGTAPFQVTATASSNLAVTFAASGTCTVSGTGSPPVSPATVTLTSTGTCTVTASQPGNGSFNAAPDVARTFAIDLKDFYTLVGSMAQPRSYHTATGFYSGPLAGWVLVTGGLDASGAPTATSELYNPVTRTFVATGNLPSKSAGHTATLLANGKVLAVGGGNSSAEIFDPVTKSWSSAGSLSSTRSYLTATVLGDGTNRVFIAGGADNAGKTINSTILYNPSNGTFANGPNLTTARERHTATLLPNGKVLIVGGRQASGSSYITLGSAEICNATACTALVSSPSARYSHAAVALPNGTVLLAGGSNGTADLATAEILDPATGGITPAGTLQAGRRELTATGLPNGRAVAAGGQNGTTPKSASDLYQPPLAAGAPMNAARAGHTATPLKDTAGNVINVLIVGGVSGSPAKSVSSAEMYGWIGP